MQQGDKSLKFIGIKENIYRSIDEILVGFLDIRWYKNKKKPYYSTIFSKMSLSATSAMNSLFVGFSLPK